LNRRKIGRAEVVPVKRDRTGHVEIERGLRGHAITRPTDKNLPLGGLRRDCHGVPASIHSAAEDGGVEVVVELFEDGDEALFVDCLFFDGQFVADEVTRL
jgi:hypothetical protein